MRFFVFLFLSNVLASPRGLSKLFKINYLQKYRPNYCYQNTFHLLQDAKKANIPIDDGRVCLLWNGDDRPDSKQPFFATSGLLTFKVRYNISEKSNDHGAWTFGHHVFFEHENTVFDLTFYNSNKIHRKEYYDQNFLAGKQPDDYIFKGAICRPEEYLYFSMKPSDFIEFMKHSNSNFSHGPFNRSLPGSSLMEYYHSLK